MTLILGFGHYSRTGKDTTVNALISALRSRGVNAVKRSFAGDLKRVAQDLYGHLGLEGQEFYDQKENEHLRDVPLPKVHKTPVQIWCELGMHGRSVYGDTWIDKALVDEPGVQVIALADCRFFNECDAIRQRDGLLYKVVRPGILPRDTTADQELIAYTGWDEVIGHSGDILELITWAEGKAVEIFENLSRIGTLT